MEAHRESDPIHAAIDFQRFFFICEVFMVAIEHCYMEAHCESEPVHAATDYKPFFFICEVFMVAIEH